MHEQGQDVDGPPYRGAGPARTGAALEATLRLLRSVPSTSFVRPDIEVRETASGTAIGRSFKWAFLPADHLWSDEDRRDAQSRLDDFAARHGLQGAPCGSVPTGWRSKCRAGCRSSRSSLSRRLDSERETLDVSQVP